MSERTITTEATGRRSRIPDLATVTVTAIGEGDTAEIARASAGDRAATIRESIARTAIAPDQVRTVEFTVEESTQLFDSSDEVPYRATERMEVDCMPDTAEDVVETTIGVGGTIPMVEFSLHEDERLSLAEEALEDAVRRAREKAERIAAVEGLEVTGVLEISPTEHSSGIGSIADAAIERPHDANVRPTAITVTEAISMVFEIDEP